MSGSAALWSRRLTNPLAAATVLAAFWIFMVASLRDKSVTCDETAHATAGYTYWKFNDYRLQPENGNLPQRLGGLPLIFGDFSFPPPDSPLLRTSGLWNLGRTWFNKMGNPTEAMLFRGRAASGLSAVVLGALVWWCSRQLFGPWGGLLSLLLYVLNPTILANGALMTSDTASSLFFLASAGSLWAMLHRLSLARVLLSALSMGGLFVSKMLAFLIVPMALTLLAARLISGRPLPVGKGGKFKLTGRGSQALAFAGAAFVHAVVVFVVIWASYGFRYSAFAPVQPGRAWQSWPQPWEWVLERPPPNLLLLQLKLSSEQWDGVRQAMKEHGAHTNKWSSETLEALDDLGPLLSSEQKRKLDELRSAPPSKPAPRIIDFLRRRQWLPEAYLYGHAHVWRESRQRPAFFNGEFGNKGWKSFFPYTFLVKTPLPVFGVILLAMAAGAVRWREAKKRGSGLPSVIGRAFYETLPWWTLLTFYWAVVIPSHLNIGHRHIMPTYAPLFVLCGAAAWWLERMLKNDAGGRTGPGSQAARAAGLALVGLVVALAAEIFYRFPNYLAYFNGIVSPARAYRHLVDSSLDWGQDLPGVKRYIEKHRLVGPVYLSYFGDGSPGYYRIPAIPLCSYPAWDALDSPLLRVLSPEQAAGAPAGWQRQFPDYDFVGALPDGTDSSPWLLKKPAALRLTGGTYFISATMLQPVMFYGYVARSEGRGGWNGRHEAIYQELRRTVQPLLDDDLEVRRTALGQRSPISWLNRFDDFDRSRFLRLAAWLRQREPDDHVNFSILVYQLTGEDIARALDGPPPGPGSPLVAKQPREEVLGIGPDGADAPFERGQVLARMGRPVEAREQYEQALCLNPDQVEAYFALGNVFLEMGGVTEAVQCYEEALSLKPDYAEAHYNLGNVLSQTGRIPEGIAHYEAAVRIKPGYARAHSNLGNVLLAGGRTQEALAHYAEAVRLQPDSAIMHNSLGHALFQLGRLAEARQHYEEALRIKPDYALARQNLARLQELQPGNSK